MDVETIIRCGGGVGKTAKTLGVSHSTVCGWRQLGYIPSARIVQISRAFGLPIAAVAAVASQRADAPGESTSPATRDPIAISA